MSLSTPDAQGGKDEEQLTFTVGGMDCASCAAKIETALTRLPGVADLSVSVARERMKLSLDEEKTSVAKIEDTIRKLGYKPALLPRESTTPGSGRSRTASTRPTSSARAEAASASARASSPTRSSRASARRRGSWSRCATAPSRCRRSPTAAA